MRIALLGLGSRGDVEPLVALGLGLAGAGHDVRVTVPRDLLTLVGDRGLSAAPFDLDIREASATGPGLEWQAEGSRGPWQELRHLRALAALIAVPTADGVLEAAADADLVVSGALTFGPAAAACAHHRTRHLLALLAPTGPSRHGPSTAFAFRPDRESRLNLAGSGLAALAAYRVFAPASALVRARAGLHRGSLGDYLRTAYATPALLACSPAVVPPAPDWPRSLRATGYWPLAVPAGWTPPDDLLQFLAAGPPPVYLGFGSMMARDPQATGVLLVRALERAGRRGLVSAGWTGLAPRDLPDTVRVVGDVPHSWLLPRTAAVVHHGGAGTTGAAARAGVPQVVVPHVGDQPYWGRRVASLGVGPEPIRRHELDVGRLASAVHRATTDPAMRRAAAALGQALRVEDGVGRAVDLIQDYLARTGRSGRPAPGRR